MPSCDVDEFVALSGCNASETCRIVVDADTFNRFVDAACGNLGTARAHQRLQACIRASTPSSSMSVRVCRWRVEFPSIHPSIHLVH